ncbi:hypothetical protein GIB67_017683, partial [Kingdonia uniflora]
MSGLSTSGPHDPSNSEDNVLMMDFADVAPLAKEFGEGCSRPRPDSKTKQEENDEGDSGEDEGDVEEAPVEYFHEKKLRLYRARQPSYGGLGSEGPRGRAVPNLPLFPRGMPKELSVGSILTRKLGKESRVAELDRRVANLEKALASTRRSTLTKVDGLVKATQEELLLMIRHWSRSKSVYVWLENQVHPQ